MLVCGVGMVCRLDVEEEVRRSEERVCDDIVEMKSFGTMDSGVLRDESGMIRDDSEMLRDDLQSGTLIRDGSDVRGLKRLGVEGDNDGVSEESEFLLEDECRGLVSKGSVKPVLIAFFSAGIAFPVLAVVSIMRG